jgi:hypothetical protein
MSRLFADALRGQRAWTPEEIERLRQGQQVPVQNNAGLPMDPGVFRQQEAANPTGIVEPPPSLAQAVAGGAAFAPMRPAVDRTVTVRGMSPSLGMEEAQYDFAGNAFAGGRTGGQSFQDFSAFQQAIERGRQGQAPAGVPSADYLSSAVLGRAMPGGLPHLDQQRNLAAVQLQQQYADRQNLLDRQQLANQGELDRTRVAVEGKTPGSEEKARLAAEAAVAQAIQGGFTPEAAADQGRRMYQAIQQALPGMRGSLAPAGGAPAAGGAAPAQSSALADQILGAVMPTSRNAQGVMARGASPASRRSCWPTPRPSASSRRPPGPSSSRRSWPASRTAWPSRWPRRTSARPRCRSARPSRARWTWRRGCSGSAATSRASAR